MGRALPKVTRGNFMIQENRLSDCAHVALLREPMIDDDLGLCGSCEPRGVEHLSIEKTMVRS